MPTDKDIDLSPKTARVILLGFLTVFSMFITAVFISGSSFGQRCTKAGYENTEHDNCVSRLAKFGVLHVKDLPSWTKE